MTVGLHAVNTANKWLNTLRGGGNGTTWTAPTTLTVKLHTADPGSAGTTAYSAGSGATQTISFAAASGGVTGTATVGGAWTNGGTNETLTHISVWDTTTFLWSAALTASKAWASADTFTLTSCSLTVTPIAA
jgi:hypothetical protein